MACGCTGRVSVNTYADDCLCEKVFPCLSATSPLTYDAAGNFGLIPPSNEGDVLVGNSSGGWQLRNVSFDFCIKDKDCNEDVVSLGECLQFIGVNGMVVTVSDNRVDIGLPVGNEDGDYLAWNSTLGVYVPTAFPGDMDQQTLDLVGNQLTISNGNTVSLPVVSISSGDLGTITDDGAGNITYSLSCADISGCAPIQTITGTNDATVTHDGNGNYEIDVEHPVRSITASGMGSITQLANGIWDYELECSDLAQCGFAATTDLHNPAVITSPDGAINVATTGADGQGIQLTIDCPTLISNCGLVTNTDLTVTDIVGSGLINVTNVGSVFTIGLECADLVSCGFASQVELDALEAIVNDHVSTDVIRTCADVQGCISELDSPTIDFTLTNGVFSGNVKLDPNAGNLLQVTANGLRLDCNALAGCGFASGVDSHVAATITGDNSMSVVASGTDNQTFNVSVDVSSTAGNQLTVNPDGLFVPTPAIQTCTDVQACISELDSDTIDFNYVNGVFSGDVRIVENSGIVITNAGLDIDCADLIAHCGLAVSSDLHAPTVLNSTDGSVVITPSGTDNQTFDLSVSFPEDLIMGCADVQSCISELDSPSIDFNYVNGVFSGDVVIEAGGGLDIGANGLRIDCTELAANCSFINGVTDGCGTSGTVVNNELQINITEQRDRFENINGTTVNLSATPCGEVKVYRDGLLQWEGANDDYTIAGNTITFTVPFGVSGGAIGNERVQVLYFTA